MKCPNCGTVCKSSQQVWQEKMQAQGRCISCAKPKSEKDMPHLKCFGCRRKDTTRDKNRRTGAIDRPRSSADPT